MMTFTIHACYAARISITSMGRHIQNAKFANFPDYVDVTVSVNLFVDVCYCYIIGVPGLLGVASIVAFYN